MQRVWGRLGEIGPALRSAGYEMVVAPSFSNWIELSPLDALTAMAMSAESARALNKAIPTIPTILGRNVKDAERWAKWLAISRPPSIALHASTHRSDREWSWFIGWLYELDRALAKEGIAPRLLVCGPSTIERVRAVVELWRGDVSVMNHVALQTAIGGKMLDHRWMRLDSNLSRLELKRINVDVVAEQVHDLTKHRQICVISSSKTIEDGATGLRSA